MSVENLKKYGKMCAESEEIREKAREIGLHDLDGHIAHGHSLGLEFSVDDFAALGKEAGLDGKNEISEEDLKKVAGGDYTLTSAEVSAGAVAELCAAAQYVWGHG
jgi:hypothetical protein